MQDLKQKAERMAKAADPGVSNLLAIEEEEDLKETVTN
jgi:hypothetical protein